MINQGCGAWTPRRALRVLCAALGASCVLLVASCATSKGSTLGKVSSSESGQASKPSGSPPQEPAQNPPNTTRGLQVLTDPSSAEVWIDGDFKGLSPFVWEDISVGWHRVILRKEGYYESSSWVQFTGDPLLYQTSLTEIIGFLQVTATPADVLVTVDGQEIPSGTQQVRAGAHEVTVRSFGYTPYTASVQINEKAVTALTVNLQPAAFDVTTFSVPKTTVNPANPGLIGSIEVNFSVTGPGKGQIHVTDATGTDVYTRELPGFTTWDQSVTWDVHTSTGAVLPDGVYTLSLTASGSESGPAVSRQSPITVDSTLKVAQRSVWSGSSGLLYAPVSEVLPPGDFQVGVLGAGIATLSDIRVPVQLGVRIGAAPGMEMDASVGLVATSTVLPVTASLAARWNLLSPHGGYGTGAALQVKIAGQVVTTQDTAYVDATDTFANFTGISVEVPLQLALGPVSGLLSFGVTGSFWYPYSFQADGVSLKVGPVAWMYLRAGVLFDIGSVTLGLSATTRTQQLPGGYAFLSSPVPFQAGAEVHWLVPDTRLVVSGIFAGEYQDSSNYYFMGGAGLGFLY